VLKNGERLSKANKANGILANKAAILGNCKGKTKWTFF
jgi:hypothetical protein